MVYLVDIGNTAVKYCKIAPNNSICARRTLPLPEACKACQEIIAAGASTVILAATASADVVRTLQSEFCEAGVQVRELCNTHQMPFVSRYASGEAGIDRLANVAGAIATVDLPVVVVDAGSAITLEVVDSEGTFAGGAILPGLKIQAQSLNRETGRLPEITLDFPRTCIATNTMDAIRTGIVTGTVGALKQLIDGIASELGSSPNIVLTGGDSDFLLPYLDFDFQVDRDLTLRGLVILATHNSLV